MKNLIWAVLIAAALIALRTWYGPVEDEEDSAATEQAESVEPARREAEPMGKGAGRAAMDAVGRGLNKSRDEE